MNKIILGKPLLFVGYQSNIQFSLIFKNINKKYLVFNIIVFVVIIPRILSSKEATSGNKKGKELHMMLKYLIMLSS